MALTKIRYPGTLKFRELLVKAGWDGRYLIEETQCEFYDKEDNVVGSTHGKTYPPKILAAYVKID